MPFVCTGFTLYPIAIGLLIVPADRTHAQDRRVDWLGAAAITAGQLLLTLALTLSVSNSRGWKAPCKWLFREVVTTELDFDRADLPPLVVIAILLFILFVWRQIVLNRSEKDGHTPPPLTPARLFSQGRGQLIALYASAICVWSGVDVSLAQVHTVDSC